MQKCEVRRCAKPAIHDVSYYDKDGKKVREKLCEMHGDRRPRNSWYVCKRFLYVIPAEALNTESAD